MTGTQRKATILRCLVGVKGKVKQSLMGVKCSRLAGRERAHSERGMLQEGYKRTNRG